MILTIVVNINNYIYYIHIQIIAILLWKYNILLEFIFNINPDNMRYYQTKNPYRYFQTELCITYIFRHENNLVLIIFLSSIHIETNIDWY